MKDKISSKAPTYKKQVVVLPVCAAVVSIPRPRIPRPAVCLRPLSPSTDVDLTSEYDPWYRPVRVVLDRRWPRDDLVPVAYAGKSSRPRTCP